jgi:hypothetical protein
MIKTQTCKVLIIGAGSSGSIARFSLGESLPPQGMAFIQQAGMLEAVDWKKDFAGPLQRGVDTFREYVDAWYKGLLQDVIFYQNSKPEIKAMISSILAGYAWDEQNPHVKNARARFDSLAEVCR